MFARSCPPTTSASDMSRTESYSSRQIRSPRSPSTWSECRSRCKPERVETALSRLGICHKTLTAKKGRAEARPFFAVRVLWQIPRRESAVSTRSGLQRLRHSDQVDGDLGDLICREE